MPFKGTENRLNPIAPEGVEDTTLGGYPAVHGRAPGFEGADGRAYTVAIETERSGADGGWVAYLIFLRWAEGGTAIMGHLETDDVASGATEREARAAAEAISLTEVKKLLDESIDKKRRLEAELASLEDEAPSFGDGGERSREDGKRS